MIRLIQIQTNIYTKSVQQGGRIIYPTISNMILDILSGQFRGLKLPPALQQQFSSDQASSHQRNPQQFAGGEGRLDVGTPAAPAPAKSSTPDPTSHEDYRED